MTTPLPLTDAQAATIDGIRGRVAAKLMPWKLAEAVLPGPDGCVVLRYLDRDQYAGSILVDPAGRQHLGPGWNRAEAVVL